GNRFPYTSARNNDVIQRCLVGGVCGVLEAYRGHQRISWTKDYFPGLEVRALWLVSSSSSTRLSWSEGCSGVVGGPLSHSTSLSSLFPLSSLLFIGIASYVSIYTVFLQKFICRAKYFVRNSARPS
ncbi:hypothetical protein GBAR_LOCUS20532, partial [Geodia barretti]